jgi:hypothetical protein
MARIQGCSICRQRHIVESKQMKKLFKTEINTALELSKEEMFIINCLRSEFGKKGNGGDTIFDLSNIDWNIVYAKSMQWGLASLLSKIIKKRTRLDKYSDIPNDFLQKIKVYYLNNFLANEKTFKKLSEVLRVFNETGIGAILLKGSHLAPFVYKDIGLRPMSDIDILVKKEDLSKVEELLLKMGYAYDTTTNSVEWWKTNHLHLPFSHPAGIRLLEIHWSIVKKQSPFTLDMEGFWKRAKHEKFNGIDILVPSAEDTLLHLCFHASHDDMFRCSIRPFCDIAAIVTHFNHEIDWNELTSRANEWGFQKYLFLTLSLSREMIGAQVPDKILNELTPGFFNEGIALEAQKRVFFREKDKPAITNITHMEKLHPDLSFPEKLSNIFHEIFISPEEMTVRYKLPPSSRRIYFYYIVRFLSLLYRKIPLYASFLLHILINKKDDFYNYNLDTWLIPFKKDGGTIKGAIKK